MSWIIYDENTFTLISKHDTEPSIESGQLKADVGNHYFLPGQSVRNFKYDGGSIVERTVEEVVAQEVLQDQYTDYYKGLMFVKKRRWYGININYGEGYERANYNYGSTDFDELPTLAYYHGVGSHPIKKGKLKKILISFIRCNGDIENLHILVNKMTKNHGATQITNKTLLHEDTEEKGHEIIANRPYFIELQFNEDVDIYDTIQVLFNSSDSSNSTRYLYSTELKYYYE